MIPFGLTRLQAALAGFIGISLVIIALLLFGHHAGAVSQQKKDAPLFASLQQTISRLTGQVDGLTGALSRQNAAVDQLKADADAKAKAAEVQIKAARSQADRYRLRASQIAAAKPTGDTCVAARDLVISTLKEERQ